MRKLLQFLSYNNAVPIAVSILIVGAGSSFAATNPETIYSATSTVLSVDNTYIVNKDFSVYSPEALITNVTEDDVNYYVDYQLSTVDVVDNVWRDTVKNMQLTVSKASLGTTVDLGVYATKEIREVVDYEKSRLVKTQEIEKKQVSNKVVATTYNGLVGQFLSDTTETLPGYIPVIPSEPEPVAQIPPVPNQAASAASSDSPPSSPPPLTTTSSQGSLTLQIMGNNPARIVRGTSYIDLGVYVQDPATDHIVDLLTFVDGKEVPSVQLDTSFVATYTIEYRASDRLGNAVSASRTVEVYDPNAPVAPVATTTEAVIEPVEDVPAPEPPTAAAPANSTPETAASSTTP